MNNKNEFKPENGDIHKARGKKSINCKKGFKRLLCDHFQRENEVHFRALGFPEWQDTAPQVRHP